VATVEENRSIVQAALPEAIHVGDGGRALEEAIADSDAVAIGPGLGRDSAACDLLVRTAASGACALVIDADALNLAAEGVVDLPALAARRPLLLTPHPGEMGRLRPHPPDGGPLAVLEDGVGAFGCAVLLKGAPSLVGSPDGPVMVDTQSSSDLAVAGMGDTLTGACAALTAQGLPPAEAGAVALYLTGRAAHLAGLGPGLTPSDVAERLPDALTEPRTASSDLDLPFVLFDADPAY
jgi:NAD(P)H-hydrate epimerase